MKLILGIIIGIIIVLSIKTTYADSKSWSISKEYTRDVEVTKIQDDGNVNCYVVVGKSLSTAVAISCVKVR